MKSFIKIFSFLALLAIIVFASTLDSKPAITNSKNDINYIHKAIKIDSKDVYVYICNDDESCFPYFHSTKKCGNLKCCPKSCIKKITRKKAIKKGYEECPDCQGC